MILPFGLTVARADTLFFDETGSQINVYFDGVLIQTATGEAIQTVPVDVANPVFRNVNIYDSTGALSDVIEFQSTPVPGLLGLNAVSVSFTSASGAPLTPAAGNPLTLTETGQIQTAETVTGSLMGLLNYSVDIQFRSNDGTGAAVPEPASFPLFLTALPLLWLLRRRLAA